MKLKMEGDGEKMRREREGRRGGKKRKDNQWRE
jgi:hypothetical protein